MKSRPQEKFVRGLKMALFALGCRSLKKHRSTHISHYEVRKHNKSRMNKNDFGNKAFIWVRHSQKHQEVNLLRNRSIQEFQARPKNKK